MLLVESACGGAVFLDLPVCSLWEGQCRLTLGDCAPEGLRSVCHGFALEVDKADKEQVSVMSMLLGQSDFRGAGPVISDKVVGDALLDGEDVVFPILEWLHIG